MDINKPDLNIPQDVEKELIEQFGPDYWLEIPIDWRNMPISLLKMYPITQPLAKYLKKSRKAK